MRGRNLTFLVTALVFGTAQAEARSPASLLDAVGGGPIVPMSGVLQCVPFARDTSGIKLYGDAHTWWKQAEGKYARGMAPRPGSVMAIRPHGNSILGHVATVRRVVDARTILVDHANWSAPGKIERNVTVVDVSPDNDWSQVRVWYAPIQALGGGHWPVAGFIYKEKPGDKPARMLARQAPVMARAAPAKPGLTRYVPTKTVQVRFGSEPIFSGAGFAPYAPSRAVAKRAAPVRLAKATGRKDPIGLIIASAR